MRNRFEQQMEILNLELIKMGALCETAIASAAKAVFDYDRKLAVKVSETDKEIDKKEKDIESLCHKLLLQEQPVARDLRIVSSALRMISDMERIGDQASEIAEISAMIKDGISVRNPHLNFMANCTIQMVNDSVDSFVKKDMELAKKVIVSDDIIDGLFDKVKQDLIQSIDSKSANGEVYIDYMMIAKYFERIGDHAANIAEWVIYSITGQHVEKKML